MTEQLVLNQNQRDCLALSPAQTEDESTQTPAQSGSFLVSESAESEDLLEERPECELKLKSAIGLSALMANRTKGADTQALSFSPNPDYEHYLRMHKVFVGKVTAKNLVGVYESLRAEKMPRYLSVAGWAAAEAALVQTDEPAVKRLKLLNGAVDCWERAVAIQNNLNKGDKPHLIEHSTPYRMALDIAITPLLRGIVLGDVTDKICDQAFEDTLMIACANMTQYNLAKLRQDHDAIADHSGFAYECNALLSLNRLKSKTWFAIPALARSDSGYYYPEQTHDLSVIRQKWGAIQNVTPVEVKSAANGRAKRRYKALLVRGKMHLSLPGKYPPGETLNAIVADHQGLTTQSDKDIVSEVSGNFMEMLKDYYAGDVLDSIATKRSLTGFRDNSIVVSKHPGLAPNPAA